MNEYLLYLADRNYSPKTIRSNGFDLLAFCRWLHAEQIDLVAVTTDALLLIVAKGRTGAAADRGRADTLRMGTGRSPG